MVGIFSRFSVGRSAHRRSKSSLDERDVMPPNPDVATAADAASATATAHGIDVAVEFKPVERPIEPLDGDRPIQCPLPEPSILNDGRIWKGQLSANVRRVELPVIKDGDTESEATGMKPQPIHSGRLILPSLSAPEHNLLNLLEECNASGI
ncbi:uncharacterized protein LOC120207025 [Hibiscus syriacus]|uniref:uncharacterized protein LOC120207025 n=1 Tax=Hibiscus syriacus TaxID=106335 RepID=UPI001924EA7A|nr:uncharacterized protein LOC120207025 [Hibiscus syriacus]XP_039062481.1 uncharacterized protein LOC120207025 [Hibiscus syriacus]